VAIALTLLFSDESPTTATHVAEVVLIVVGAGLTIAATWLFFLAFQEVPRLQVGAPVVETMLGLSHDTPSQPLEHSSGSGGTTTPLAAARPDEAAPVLDVARLHVSNMPKRGRSPANGVYVRLNFHDATNGAPLHAVWARWSTAAPGTGSGDSPGPPQADIPALSAGVLLDVATKFRGEVECHAVDQDSGTLGLSALPLGSGCVVHVVARGANTKADSAWYEVHHEGTGSTLQLDAIRRPTW
jgi:hypothetical protein